MHISVLFLLLYLFMALFSLIWIYSNKLYKFAMYSFLFFVYVFVFISGAAKVGQKQKSVCCVIFPGQGFF